MEIKIFSAREYNARLKCTIHASGKLGFTEETARQLSLSTNSGIKFATNENKDFFLINTKERDEETFTVYKSGNYYYVNAKPLFDSLGFDYRNNVIIFDMSKERHETLELYKLNKREKTREIKSKI